MTRVSVISRTLIVVSVEKKGHISRACYLKSHSPSGKMPQRPATHHHTKWMAAEDPPSDIKENRLLSVGLQSSHPITVDMVINSTTLSMEVDTGAAVSVISEDTSKALFPDMALQPTQIVLKTYTGEQMQVRGQMTVEVQYQDQLSKSLTLLVVAGNSPSLLGCNWSAHFHLDWKTIASVSTTQEGTPMNPDTLLKCYKDLFSEKLGTIHRFMQNCSCALRHERSSARQDLPPLAIRAAIDSEMDRLEAAGITQPVAHSDGAAPVVVVQKKDGKICLCGDYKVSINPALEVEQYLLSKPDELFATLAGEKQFSKLDLSQA